MLRRNFMALVGAVGAGSVARAEQRPIEQPLVSKPEKIIPQHVSVQFRLANDKMLCADAPIFPSQSAPLFIASEDCEIKDCSVLFFAGSKFSRLFAQVPMVPFLITSHGWWVPSWDDFGNGGERITLLARLKDGDKSMMALPATIKRGDTVSMRLL